MAGILERAKDAVGNLVNRTSAAGQAAEGMPEANRGETANPADPVAKGVTGRNRIPLSIPRLKLDAPKIPGFVCQWFADRPGRIRQAQEAGYAFVSPDEIALNESNVANDVLGDGNTDMGSGVSTYGGVSEQGTAERLYLMKIQEDWWKADQKVIADRNESVAQAIRGGIDVAGNPHEARGDENLRYLGRASGAPMKRQQPNLFTRKRGS